MYFIAYHFLLLLAQWQVLQLEKYQELSLIINLCSNPSVCSTSINYRERERVATRGYRIKLIMIVNKVN